jgi:hypothetical protein
MTSPQGGDVGRKKRPVFVPVLAVLLATGLGMTALLGGLNEMPYEPSLLGPGDVLDQGQFTTLFVGAKYGPVPGADETAPDRRLLDIEFKVTNRSDETVTLGAPQEPGKVIAAFTLFAGSILKTEPALRTEFGSQAFVASRGVESGQLHPGVTATVIVRYSLDAKIPPPKQIVLHMGGFELTERFLGDYEEWMGASQEVDGKLVPQTLAQVTLPVRQTSQGGV